MKRTTLFLFLAVIFFINTFGVLPSHATVLSPEITAPSGILIDAATGDVLYEKNAHEKMYPASTTKIMTAILVLENSDLQDIVIIDKDTPFTDGSRIYVLEDEEFTVEQLLYALLVQSANDAAVALAKHVSGSVEAFTALMNQRAKELGAKNTNFVNPNGLPNEAHISTAYDLAMIAKHGMTIPAFREFVSTVRYEIPPTNKQQETRHLRSSNRFLWGTGGNNRINYRGKWINIKYDIVDGIKTGYTLQAQQCLVASAIQNDHRVISVVLKAQNTNIYLDSRTLIDYGFENFHFEKVVDANEFIEKIPIKGGIKKEVNLIAENVFYKAVPKGETINSITKDVVLREDLSAPIEKGERLGKIVYTSEDQIIGEVNLIAEESIAKKEGLYAAFPSAQRNNIPFSYFIAVPLFAYLLWRSFVTIQRSKKRKNRGLSAKKNRKKSYENDLTDINFYYYDKRD
ncbi:D-alanyl-D-alanine carboxypeptidase family protein [Geosporobacter ferrireducens]|uniref:serine-type D-Ala-D-Ala carboxypeptidase n=1 Tax=Geosporobacter ferrireducens TaxID=1424294 RepID=A0A1D8GPF2_9FIRM|nr:D-alanyl-D-alanine carboxypeptidase family protein [Geosporobacter ferrireducens]AOT72782.1 hypothetical protein Gferi_26425 [Geosporobacter ferrireducens]MTI55198.1 D-alanyl-D-alanine carboxypeptidase [Geosporobacter ferrireducens]